MTLKGLLATAAALSLAISVSAIASEDISHNGTTIIHQGSGIFIVSPPLLAGDPPAVRIDLTAIEHGYDQEMDPDVPHHTNVTLNDIVPSLVDSDGREFARITFYQVDPPLADLPSREAGIDRGIDMRSPADMVKSAYSNYVSPVLTDDTARHPVPIHPIGHFFVKVEISGYPTILTGMTTILRADEELVDLTLGRQLGIGGVLLTPQPGRLNSSEEALDELQLRQMQLRVIDGLHYKPEGGKNVGPEYLVEDGNVVFARFRLPPQNAKDAVAFFVDFLQQGQHRIFGSLIGRPYKGTGAGCAPFAMAWLKAAGIVPFVTEPTSLATTDLSSDPLLTPTDLWQGLHRTVFIPWDHVGCDDRVGASRTIPANYTIYDLLFHEESDAHLLHAVPGLARKIQEDYGPVAATLFAFGARTPLRDLVVTSKRKDPEDTGNYDWTTADQGLRVQFWDNDKFSDWIKQLWESQETPNMIELAREGRFLGIEVDAMNTPRQTEAFFTNTAETLTTVGVLDTCAQVFQE